jgi:phosphohistidine phosphatase
VIYLVRHGEAEQSGERPLTPNGRADVAKVAAWAASCNLRPQRILHSGILRAAQTAEILGQWLHPEETAVHEGLSPEGEPETAAPWLRRQNGDLMLVTHLPFIAALSAQLLVGENDGPLLDFQPGTIAAFDRGGEHWQLRWLIDPDLITR